MTASYDQVMTGQRVSPDDERRIGIPHDRCIGVCCTHRSASAWDAAGGPECRMAEAGLGECPMTWLAVTLLALACAYFVGVVWLTNQ